MYTKTGLLGRYSGPHQDTTVTTVGRTPKEELDVSNGILPPFFSLDGEEKRATTRLPSDNEKATTVKLEDLHPSSERLQSRESWKF